MKKLAVSCWLLAVSVAMAAGVAAFADSGISSSAPEVWFRFDDKSVSEYQQNEGTLGSAVSFAGSYSTIGMNKGGATYVKTSGGYGVHSYSPWCHDIPFGDEFTVALRLQATNEANRILFCLGALQGDNEVLMLTTKDAQNLQLVVVKGTEVRAEAWIHVDDVTAFNTYVIRYVNGQVAVNVNGAPEACSSVSYNHTSGAFQLLGGYNKQTTMPEYFHGCGVVDNSTGTVNESYTANVIDDFCIWTKRQISTDEISQYAQGQIPSSYYHMVEYVCADGTTMSRHIGAEGIITADTETISNGNWYVVEKSVSRKMIRVVGSAHLILCDGAMLTVNDDKQPGIALTDDHELTIYGQTKGTGELVAISGRAGIGGGYMFDSFYPPRRRCGKLTINGGKVTAQGGGSAVGIGGFSNGNGGSITINGGTVTATGGSGGIGNGAFASGGTVTINGGTVTAAGVDHGAGINAVVRINGGNVIASSMSTAPVNGAGSRLRKVTLNAPDGGASVFEGLGGYGLRDVVPVGGKYYFYLPDGGYEVSVGTADVAHGYYYFIVNGKDVACDLLQIGLTVNGVNVSEGSGSGWTYRNRVLELDSGADPFVLSGISTFGDVQVRAASDCTVDLNDAIIYTQGRPAFVVDEGKTATLRMKGGVSHLAATNGVDGASVSAIKVDGTLNVDFAPDAEQTQSAIYAFNFGAQPAIGGNGEVSVISGHLCAWSDDKAVGSGCNFYLADSAYGKTIGQVGDSWSDMKFAGCGYSDQAKFYDYSQVEVAPAYWVYVPVSIEHVRGITVSNSWEALRHESVGALTNRYCGMLEDVVSIAYELEDGCVIVGANPQVIPLLTKDVVIGSGDYPLPEVRKSLTVTLPEVLAGETYVVRVNGEVEDEVEVGGRKVYSVLSGYDVEIFFAAQEGWRIVSESNVVTFANIQESKVLTAADLPRAWRLFTVNVPAIPHAVHNLTSTDGDMAETEPGHWQILSNAEVTVTFTAAANYRITTNGEKTWTLTGDVTFGTTEGFPLPTVEGIPGTIAVPWAVGESVQAYTNAAGVLTITGMGVMDDFASATEVPWDPTTVTAVTFGEGVAKIGKNAFAGIDEEVKVNGTALSYHHEIADAMGITAAQSPSGAISGAEFERIDIIDGKAYLGVSVYTNSEVKVRGEGVGEGVGGEGAGWGVATNGVIIVPAPGKQGFFYLMSKPAVPSDVVPHSPIALPVFDPEIR